MWKDSLQIHFIKLFLLKPQFLHLLQMSVAVLLTFSLPTLTIFDLSFLHL